MAVVVSDSAVLLHLERGALLAPMFELAYVFVVPDIIYRHELEASNGPELIAMGLEVMELAAKEVTLAVSYRQRQSRLAVPDAFALALAESGEHFLITGSGDAERAPSHILLSQSAALRELASLENVESYNVLWVLDQIEAAGILPKTSLATGLSAIAAHPRHGLPDNEIADRISRYLR